MKSEDINKKSDEINAKFRKAIQNDDIKMLAQAFIEQHIHFTTALEVVEQSLKEERPTDDVVKELEDTVTKLKINIPDTNDTDFPKR